MSLSAPIGLFFGETTCLMPNPLHALPNAIHITYLTRDTPIPESLIQDARKRLTPKRHFLPMHIDQIKMNTLHKSPKHHSKVSLE